VCGCHLLQLFKPVWNKHKANNWTILSWQAALKSFFQIGSLCPKWTWIVLYLTWLCTTVPFCKQLCSDDIECSIATNEHHFPSTSNLNINCISGLAIAKLNCLWLIHLKAITLRTRYSLVCEWHQSRAQEGRNSLLLKTQKP